MYLFILFAILLEVILRGAEVLSSSNYWQSQLLIVEVVLG